ncbi:MAG: transporter substrate-binding domain-containing protein [Ruminococcaceae bacterium]|nr:transporter substrate-binding domain-containing protein [Oscillospiraceae bacterium]
MKKFLALMLCAFMMLTMFAACGTKDTADSADKKENKAEDLISATETDEPKETEANEDENAEDEVAVIEDVAAVKEAGQLIVGITEYEPMNYLDENGEWTGFDTEFAQAFCETLGVEANFVVIDWDNKYTELEAGTIDCIWNGMTITEEGMLNASISAPYVKNAQVVVMADDVVEDYADAESMADLTFAVESGSAGATVAADNGFNVVEVLDQATALYEVSSGSCDACVIDITMANAMTADGASYEDYGYVVELSTEEYGVAFRKGSDLTETFNNAFVDMMNDGTLDALAAEYELTLVK